MADPSRDIDPLNRIRCFICDAYRYPSAMVRECNAWVCRQCVNYEGSVRLPYTIRNVSLLKNAIHHDLSVRVSNPTAPPGVPLRFNLPPNNSCIVPVANQSASALPVPTPRNNVACNVPSSSGINDNN